MENGKIKFYFVLTEIVKNLVVNKPTLWAVLWSQWRWVSSFSSCGSDRFRRSLCLGQKWTEGHFTSLNFLSRFGSNNRLVLSSCSCWQPGFSFSMYKPFLKNERIYGWSQTSFSCLMVERSFPGLIHWSSHSSYLVVLTLHVTDLPSTLSTCARPWNPGSITCLEGDR